MKEIVIESLCVVVNLVEEFDALLVAKYNLEDIPYNEAGHKFPRIGQLNNNGQMLNYKFHGSGCKIEVGNMILEYGISPITENKIKITPRDLMIFMKSYRKENEIHELISKDLHLLFIELEEEGVLKKRPESIANFEIISPPRMDMHTKASADL